jgi:hypothetical protein
MLATRMASRIFKKLSYFEHMQLNAHNNEILYIAGLMRNPFRSMLVTLI